MPNAPSPKVSTWCCTPGNYLAQPGSLLTGARDAVSSIYTPFWRALHAAYAAAQAGGRAADRLAAPDRILACQRRAGNMGTAADQARLGRRLSRPCGPPANPARRIGSKAFVDHARRLWRNAQSAVGRRHIVSCRRICISAKSLWPPSGMRRWQVRAARSKPSWANWAGAIMPQNVIRAISGLRRAQCRARGL